jgi:hypothetical protein
LLPAPVTIATLPSKRRSVIEPPRGRPVRQHGGRTPVKQHKPSNAIRAT